MAEIIYSKNGTVKAMARSVRYTGTFMGVPQLEVSAESPVPVNFEVGDYIVFSYDSIRYSIIDLPQVQKQSSSGSVGNAFVYENVVFKSPLGLLSSIDFLDTVLSDNNIHYSTLPVFSFFGDIKDFADRLQANLNRIYSSGWKVTVEGYDESSNANYDILHDYKEISLSNQNCLDALGIPYGTWKIAYVFTLDNSGNNCIIFNHALDSASARSYGKGNGLYSLTKRISTEKPVITRLRAYGSTDNLPSRYYNDLDGIDDGIYLPNLMIPRSKWKNQNDPVTAYIDSTDIDENDTSMSRYGIREKSVFFDGSNDTEKIEPTIKGVTAGMIRAAKTEMADSTNVPSSSIYPDDERMDKIVGAEDIADKGVESSGEVYTDNVLFTVEKGEDREIVFTKNGADPISGELETTLNISVPATYRLQQALKLGQIPASPVPFLRILQGIYPVTSAMLEVYVQDVDGNKVFCDTVSLYSEVVSGVSQDGGRYAYRDFYFSGAEGPLDYLYVKIPYKGKVIFRYHIIIDAAASISVTMSETGLSASTGPLIIQDKFWVRIKQIGFDINSYPSPEEAKLVVNSGGCAGRSFNIVKNSTQFDESTETWRFRCFRSQDESLNQLFPNSIYKISEDDEFVLTGLEMPELYVQMASQKLYNEAVKMLRERKDGLEVFDLEIDNKVAYSDPVKIKEGMILPLFDADLGVGKVLGGGSIDYEYRIIDSVTMDIGSNPVPIISVVLRESKEESVFKSLARNIQNISSRTTYNVVKTQVFRIAEEVVRTNAAPSSVPTSSVNTSDFVTLSTDQTITGVKTVAADVIFGGEVSEGVYGRMFIPSTEGPGKYYMYFDAVSAVDGEVPTASGGGLDVDAMWEALAGEGTQQIHPSHLSDALSGYLTEVKIDTIGDLDAGWDSLLKAAPDFYSKSDSDARYVTLATEQVVTGKKTFNNDVIFGGNGSKMFVPSTSGAGLYYMYFDVTSAVNGETPTASGGLDVDELWAELGGSSSNKVIDISHIPHIPTSDISNYLFLNPGNGVHINQNDAVPANGRFAIYDANMATTTGGNDGYIMAFRWPSGNFATQVFLDVDSTGIMALRHRSSTNAWTDWSRILHSDNIGSYALTPSNYASTLDSRYVNISGDTMTGTLTVNYDGGLVSLRGTGNPLLKLESGSYYGYVQLSTGGILSMDFGHSTGKGVYLNQSGNVGIGTSSPAYKLDINGDLNVRGNIYLRRLGSSWIAGKTQAPIMTNGDSSVNGDTYHPIIWGRTTAGDVWNLGHGANGQVGFYGFYSERTNNGTDWEVTIKVSSGLFYASHGIYTGGKLFVPSSQGNQVFDIYIQ